MADDDHLPPGGYHPLGNPSSDQAEDIQQGMRPSQAGTEMERIRTEIPEADESNRPKNSRYFQQTMRAWYPLLTPWRAVGGYVLIGLIFVVLGSFLWKDATDVVELR